MMDLLVNSSNLLMVAFAVGAGYALTWLARLVAPRIGLLDRPDGVRKLHSRPVPLMGGLAVYVACLSTYLLCRATGLGWLEGEPARGRLAWMFFLSGGLCCLVGLWDDRWAMRPRYKLFWQIAACLPFVLWGRTIQSFEFLGIDVPLGILGAAFTMLWLVACVNAVNLLDGLDGLATTTGLLVAAAAAVLSLLAGKHGVAALSSIVGASLFGFLLHNWPPARIFLGDAGSLMIGFLVGSLSIEASLKTATSVTLAAPLVVMSLPFFDALMAIVRRVLTGKGIGQGDCRHIHHRLLERGLSRQRTLLVTTSLCLATAVLAVLPLFLGGDLIAVSMCLSLLALLIVCRVFGDHEVDLLFRQTKVAVAILADAARALGSRALSGRLPYLFRLDETFRNRWPVQDGLPAAEKSSEPAIDSRPPGDHPIIISVPAMLQVGHTDERKDKRRAA